jgi:hypothetical protein
VRKILQEALCIENDIIKLFYTKTWKNLEIITTSSINEIHLFLAKINDHLKLINALVPHYQHMPDIRTLSSRIYEIRQLNIWLLQIDEALKFGNVDEINLLVNGNPNEVNILVV